MLLTDASRVSDLTKVHRPLTADEIDRWIEALESGKHHQTVGQLRATAVNAGPLDRGYCCLGLKCLIDGLDLDAVSGSYEEAGGGVVEEFYYANSGTAVYKDETPDPLLSLSYTTRHALALANDSGTYSFADLAGVLRRFRDDLLAGRSITWGGPVGGEWEVAA